MYATGFRAGHEVSAQMGLEQVLSYRFAQFRAGLSNPKPGFYEGTTNSVVRPQLRPGIKFTKKKKKKKKNSQS
jgi:hypothetical protein